ncbi:MAG: copper-binding protein [Rhodospirillales bacterium]|nr:copper-binding protein [Rhodospirillales bacterium]
MRQAFGRNAWLALGIAIAAQLVPAPAWSFVEGGQSTGVPPADWSRASTVKIALADYAFEPKEIRLDVNAPVHLVLVNTGAFAHDFSAEHFFQTAALHMSTRPLQHGAVELRPGETIALDLVPGQRGQFPLECSLEFHAAMGMTGTIDVR